MSLAVQVKLRKLGGVQHYSVARLQLMPSLGEIVILESDRGDDYGEIVSKVAQVMNKTSKAKLKKIIRVASAQDFERIKRNTEASQKAYAVCKSVISKADLPMKLITCEYTFDKKKAIFYFSSAQRVDFRQLVKDLANELKTRIELIQVGVRDEAKMLGGLGPCGCKLCCSKMLSEFTPVSIRMAKDQQLPLNPAKISGMCGRLMCCLSYEHAFYKEALKDMPKMGELVTGDDAEGKVIGLNCLKSTAVVLCEGGRQVECPCKTLSKMPAAKAQEHKQKRKSQDAK